MVALPPDDEQELGRFGYKQELARVMGSFSNFALSFSIISILTGAVSLYGYGLSQGGPFEMSVGWPLVTLMTLFVALSLGELASACPTAGALYHWAAILGGRHLGWLTAWLNLIGQIAVLAGVDYALADFALGALGIAHERLLFAYGAILASHALINHVGIRAVARLNQVSAWYHLVGTAILIVALAHYAPLQPAHFLLTKFIAPAPNGITYGFAYAFAIGLLQAQWTFTGYDASAHAAEETLDAARAVPRGMVQAVLVSGVAGYALLIATTLACGDLHAAATAPNAFTYVLHTALGERLGDALTWVVIGAMWFCGLACVTSASRMLFAFARDGGVPASARVANVSARHHTPAFAIWVCAIAAFALAVWSAAYNVIVSISTIGLYASYGIPIGAMLFARADKGPWSLGRASRPVAVVALSWIAFITVLFVLPPNEKTGYTFAALLIGLAIYHVAWARSRFKGPQVRRD